MEKGPIFVTDEDRRRSATKLSMFPWKFLPSFKNFIYEQVMHLANYVRCRGINEMEKILCPEPIPVLLMPTIPHNVIPVLTVPNVNR